MNRLKYHLTHLHLLPNQLLSIPDRLVEHAGYRETFIQQPYYWLMQDLKTDTTAIDIGAYRGETAIWLAGYNEIDKVYAYELMPQNYSRGIGNIQSSPYKDKIDFINAAVTATDQVAFAPRERPHGGNKLSQTGVRVSGVCLNTILNGMQNVIIKCDAEGAELDIFHGRVDYSNVYKLMIEYHTKKAKDSIFRILVNAGFEVGYKKHHVDTVEDNDEVGYIYATR